MHRDFEEPEVQNCNHGKLKNWVFMLLKQRSRLAQRSDNCYILHPTGGPGWGRTACSAERLGLRREYSVSQGGVKAALLGDTVLPVSFIGKGLFTNLSSIYQK